MFLVLGVGCIVCMFVIFGLVWFLYIFLVALVVFV